MNPKKKAEFIENWTYLNKDFDNDPSNLKPEINSKNDLKAKLKIILIQPDDCNSHNINSLQSCLDIFILKESELSKIETQEFNAIFISGDTKLKTPFEYLKIFLEKYKKVPTYFLNDQSSDQKIINGYETGMNDVIISSNPPEMIAAQVQSKINELQKIFRLKLFKILLPQINEELRELEFNNVSYPLTPIEYSLLKLLSSRKNQLVRKEEIKKEIWPDVSVVDGALNTHIYNLKKKIPGIGNFLKTKKNIGYYLKFTEEPTSKEIKDVEPQKKILLVDDDEEILTIIEKYIDPKNKKIYKANGVSSAMKILEDQKIDLIFLDLFMQPKDGIYFLDYMNKNKIKIPVIICSAYVNKKVTQEVNHFDVRGIVQKPFTQNDIKSAVLNTISVNMG